MLKKYSHKFYRSSVPWISILFGIITKNLIFQRLLQEFFREIPLQSPSGVPTEIQPNIFEGNSSWNSSRVFSKICFKKISRCHFRYTRFFQISRRLPVDSSKNFCDNFSSYSSSNSSSTFSGNSTTKTCRISCNGSTWNYSGILPGVPLEMDAIRNSSKTSSYSFRDTS